MMQRMTGARSMTDDDLKSIYIYLKNQPYKNGEKALEWIAKGDHAMAQNDLISLKHIVYELDKLFSAESKGEDYFINRKTGLE